MQSFHTFLKLKCLLNFEYYKAILIIDTSEELEKTSCGYKL